MDRMSSGLLEVFKSKGSLSLSQLSAILDVGIFDLSEPISVLRKQGYLRIEPNHCTVHELSQTDSISLDTPLVITFEGRAALDNHQQDRRSKKFNDLRAWITLAIACASFVLAVISLLLQQ